jgi:predicted  nucleic acid-binding Zn-ribbon protein
MPHQCTTCGRSFEDGSKEMLSGCPDCGGNKFQFQPAGAVGEGPGGKNGGGASAATARKKTPESVRSDAADTPKTNSTNAPKRGATNASKPGTTGASETEGDDRASAVNRAASTVRDWVGNRSDDSPENGGAGSTRNDASAGTAETAGTAKTDGTTDTAGTSRSPETRRNVPNSEDSAQASARSDVVSESELPDEPPQSTAPADSATDLHSTADPTTDSHSTADPATDSHSTADPAPPNDSDADANVVDAPDDKSPGLKELREELNSQFESIRIEEPGQYELNLMELYEREEYIISLQEDGKYIIEVPDAWDANDR